MNEPSTKPLLQIADNALSVYKYTLCQTHRVHVGARTLNELPLDTGNTNKNRRVSHLKRWQFSKKHLVTHTDQKAKYHTKNAWAEKETTGPQIVELRAVLLPLLPDLWMVYHVIFDFMGYHSLKSRSVTKQLHLLPLIPPKSCSNPHHGIRYVTDRPVQKRRRYAEYSKDIESYIPSHIYYHQKPDDTFLEIGEYPQSMWNGISCHLRMNTMYKRRQKELCSLNPTNSVLLSPDHTRCPCGCRRRIPGKERHQKVIYESLCRARRCIENFQASRHWHNTRFWRHRWKEYRRSQPAVSNWWQHRKKVMMACARKCHFGYRHWWRDFVWNKENQTEAWKLFVGRLDNECSLHSNQK